MVVGGTRKDNSSTNAVELLQIDDPVKCSPKSFPTNIDRAVGVNFLPIHGHRVCHSHEYTFGNVPILAIRNNKIEDNKRLFLTLWLTTL